jgi:FdrA protein
MLEQDAATGCILLISKPPAAETLGQVLDRVRTSNKPVVVCFLGADPAALAGVEYGATIEDAVLLAAGHVGAPTDPDDRYTESSMVEAERRRLQPTQRYVRGLYVGGTLADEAMLILSSVLGPINSNVPLPGRGTRLLNAAESLGNAVVDLGDDEFTQGRPHPMIDPLLRNERISREARDREVAVLLCDVVLGLGSHPDPAGVLANALRRVRSQVDSGAEHPFPAVVASVCGTPGDPQQLDRQEQVLREAGVRVMRSNAKAARVAAAIASSYREVLS